MRRCLVLGLVLVFTLFGGRSASAGPIAWVDWTSASSVTGTAFGVLTPTIGPLRTVTYTGMFAFAKVNEAGPNYWLPDTPYLSSVVSNAPSSSDVIALDKASIGYAHKIHFSSPVMDPVMAFVSIGQPGLPVYYDFDQDFTVLSFGPGYFGGPGTLESLGAGVLKGVEGHGVIQFHGLVTDISWTNQPDEYWHGFTIGAPDAAPIPDHGSSLLLLGMGFAALRASKRRLG